ncbi:hypothetical protein [Actinomadura miaoliensis]|uniref:Uncharacterized protein n=1 Tax=Actinomadura miaoliensis TaxID=430685 RepID=A0ABP7V7A4_9ACTN
MTASRVHAGPVRWDTDAIAAQLRGRFPGVLLWWSELNASWMAMVLRPTSHPVGNELLQAATPAELEQRLAAAGVRPVHPQQAVPGTGGMVAGIWSPPTPPPLPQPQRVAPLPPRRERPERLERPGSPKRPERPGPSRRPERPQRRGWLARLLDRLTYTEPWDW